MNGYEVLSRKDTILKAGEPVVKAGLADDIHGTAFRTAAIAVLVGSDRGGGVLKAWKVNYSAIMDGSFDGELVASSEAKSLIELFKWIGRTRIYCTPANLKLELMGRKIIHDLLDLFWEGVEVLPKVSGPLKTKKFEGKIGTLLSENYRRVFCHFANANPELPEAYHRFQLLTDYVCGMTDTFAKRLHGELTNG